jgi:hypothetical protein
LHSISISISISNAILHLQLIVASFSSTHGLVVWREFSPHLVAPSADSCLLKTSCGSLKGILAVWIFLLPLITVKAIHYHCRWFVLFTVLGQDYGDEERRIMTRAMVKKTFRGDRWLVRRTS